MTINYFEDKTFDKRNGSAQNLEKGEYENCRFTNCDFSEADFNEFQFSDCDFVDCNLSLSKVQKTAFRDVRFKNCKILGVLFDGCNTFGLQLAFTNCLMNHTSFFKLNLQKTAFRNCQLIESDFTETNLNSTLFDECDLTGATFYYTNLEKANLRTARNYSIDPEQNRIAKAQFSLTEIHGLLHKYGIVIHT